MSNANKVFPEKLARLFSAAAFRSLAGPAAPEQIRSLVDEAGHTGLGRRMRLRLIFDRAYERLVASYRSEYLYKNALTNSILLNRHTLDDGPCSARLLTEFWAGDARVDLGIVNGTSTAYEVKTDLDRLDRLSNQLTCYSKVFDRIFVVTSETMVPSISKQLPPHVGIIVLNRQGDLRQRRASKSNKGATDVRTIFRAMRELEVLEFCVDRFGIDPHLSNIHRMKTCWEVFEGLSPSEAHDAMVRALRKRHIHPAQQALIDASPYSLKHHAISRTMNIRDYLATVDALEAVA